MGFLEIEKKIRPMIFNIITYLLTAMPMLLKDLYLLHQLVRSKASSTEILLNPAERLQRREAKLAERLKEAYRYQNGGREVEVKTSETW